jgi:hypothetical protein
MQAAHLFQIRLLFLACQTQTQSVVLRISGAELSWYFHDELSTE